MKIAVDLDGTAFKHSTRLKNLINALYFYGFSVGIITAHPPEDVEKDLEKWFALGFPYPSFLLYMPIEEKFIGTWKRKVMEENHIDIIIDDFGGDNQLIKNSFFGESPPKFLVLQVFPGE